MVEQQGISNPPNLLPPDFVPGKWDVICQRGKECYEHVGNRRFRMCIDSHLDSYVKAKSRQQKSKIVSSIVQNIRKASSKTGGGFVRKDLLTRRWFRVDDKLAREKVGQALRDAIKTKRVMPDDDKKQPSVSTSNALTDTVTSNDGKSDFKMAISTSTDKPFNDEITKTVRSGHIDMGFSGLYDTSFAEEKHVQQLEREQDQIAQAQQQQLVNFHIPPPPSPAPSLFFNSRLSAELEPTPISQHHNQATAATNLTSSMYPSLGRGGGVSHRRSEMSASTLLRLYDQSYGGNMTRGTSNLDNTATNTAVALDAVTTRAMDLQSTRRAQLAAAELYSTPIAAAASSIEPPVLQHVLPTFIEGRRLTDTLTDSGTTMMGTTSAPSLNLTNHHNHHQLFSLSTTMNNHAELLNKLRATESSTTASNQEGLNFASNIDSARPSNTEQYQHQLLHNDNEVGAADPNTAFEDL